LFRLSNCIFIWWRRRRSVWEAWQAQRLPIGNTWIYLRLVA
jgi:hypothetical protein